MTSQLQPSTSLTPSQKISLITPTEAREEHLKHLYEVILAQEFSGTFEWLVYDTYFKPSAFLSSLQDERVRYFFSKEILTIGEKRNRLIEAATGEIICHFDDDDYYAPCYLRTVQEALKTSDFFTFDSWYCYDTIGKQLYYCSSEEESDHHFFINPLDAGNVEKVAIADAQTFYAKLRYGYGFCYAYTKKVVQMCRFDSINHGEDLNFFKNVEKAGFTIKTVPEKKGSVLHILHDKNTSRTFPQYLLPPFLLKNLFPKSDAFIDNYPDENRFSCS